MLLPFSSPSQTRCAGLWLGNQVAAESKKSLTPVGVRLFWSCYPDLPLRAQANWEPLFIQMRMISPVRILKFQTTKKALASNDARAFLELLPRFELGTSSLPRSPEAPPLLGTALHVSQSLEASAFDCSLFNEGISLKICFDLFPLSCTFIITFGLFLFNITQKI